MLRFVILSHELPPDSERADHFDLMLESDPEGPLATWELPEFPCVGEEYAARQLPPHRRAYLDYEGPMSNNRGHVTRVASGTCEWLTPTRLKLTGEQLTAVLTIESIPDDSELSRLKFSAC